MLPCEEYLDNLWRREIMGFCGVLRVLGLQFLGLESDNKSRMTTGIDTDLPKGVGEWQ
jgi:hypothetical protein